MPHYLFDLYSAFTDSAFGGSHAGIIYDGEGLSRSVWYECEAIVTNVATSLTPDQLIETSIQFVTTGPVLLRTGVQTSRLLQEDVDPSVILQESGFAIAEGIEQPIA